MSRTSIPFLMFLAFTGCSDMVVEPSPDVTATEPFSVLAAMVAPSIGCTRSWRSGVDGDWTDSTRWTPSGAPLPTDSVCLSAAGSYTVTLADTVRMEALQIGGPGAAAVLHYEPTTSWRPFVVRNVISIHAGSRLILVDGAIYGSSSLAPAQLVNNGLVRTAGFNGYLNDVDVENNGLFQMDAATSMFSANFETRGEVVVNAHTFIAGTADGSNVRLSGGRVSGSSTVYLGAGVTDTLSWTAARLETQSDDSTRTVVVVISARHLDVDTTASGTLSVLSGAAGGTHVRGSLGPAARLILSDPYQDGLDFGALDAPFTNAGQIEFLTSPLVDRRISVRQFVNSGTLDVSGSGIVRLEGDTLVNRGVMTLRTNLIAGPGTHIENRQTITVATGSAISLETGAMLRAEAGSVLEGSLVLTGGWLTGQGTVGAVRSIDGTIAPGSPVGTLSTGSMVLDSGTTVILDVAGTETGQFDQLAVAGDLVLDGTLRIEPASAHAAGVCGQVLDPISISSISSGRFHTVVNSPLKPGAAWRSHYEPNRVRLAGHRPGTGVWFEPASVAVDEGGPASQYAACLGLARPTSRVSVSRTSSSGQLAPLGSIVFDVATWALPRNVNVRAIDDAIIEAPHTDSILHSVSSADAAYDGTAAAPVAVTILDNDGASDVSLTLVYSPDAPFAGTDYRTDWQVSNAGTSTSTGSSVVSLPLTGIQFVSATGAACSVDANAVLTCTIASIATGAQLDFSLTLRGTTVGVHDNTFTVTGHQPDPVATNNTVVYTQQIR